MGKLIRINDKTYIRKADIVSITAERDAHGNLYHNAHTAKQSFYINCVICGKRIYHLVGEQKPTDNTDVYCDTCKSSYAGVEIDEPDAGVKNSEQENA